MRRASPNHRTKEEKRIKELCNEDLLEETLDLSRGDDYDGCFTRDGEITMSLLKQELEHRLKDWLIK